VKELAGGEGNAPSGVKRLNGGEAKVFMRSAQLGLITVLKGMLLAQNNIKYTIAKCQNEVWHLP
jgi:hypothetical protein